MRKVLVTGGAGFIGSAIIEHLQKQQDEIFVIDNLSFGNRDFINISDDHFLNVDIQNRTQVFDAVKKINAEVIIHLAAIHFIPYCNQHPYEASNVNIQGTINVLDAAQQTDVKQLLFASTAAVYPISDVAAKEQDETGPMDIYGLTKLTCERLCNEFYLESKINTIIARFFNAFGPNETNPHLFPEIQKQVNGGSRKIKLGNLLPKRDFIHTHDMATAVITMLANLQSGFHTLNLGSGTEYSVTEIVEAFERQLGESITVETDETRVRKVERMHLLADVSKLKALGWEPKISIDEGVKTLIQEHVAK